MSIIKTANLGIRYKMLKHRTRSLKRTIFQVLQGEFERTEFWALRGLDLEVAEGEALGVIGANGAGKSTMCLALAGILPPDEGEIEVDGRVAPILTLGAGFNRDMTGRDNIYLSGALMGLDKQQVGEMEQFVVDFAEIGDFVDNPVRTYSSGMRARLGFAIATSVEPDVLILDEVLSVGDAAFREKSRARMHHLMDRARAMVLVSHQMDTIKDLSTTALWLHHGETVMRGGVDEVVGAYEDLRRQRAEQAPA